MNKTNLLLSAFILSAMFLLGCSSDCEKCDTCEANNPSSSSVKPSSSSSGGGTVENQKLVRKNITISSEKSYADIDVEEPIAYSKGDAKSNITKIDLVAYCGTDNGYCKKPSIYRPYEIDLFMDPVFIGSDVFLFEIPKDSSDIFRTATRYSEILPTLLNLNSAGYLSGSGEKDIVIEKDKVFFVITSEDKYRFVIIKAIGNQSVDLEILLIPSN